MTRVRVDVDTRRAANDDPEVMSLGHPGDGTEAVDLRQRHPSRPPRRHPRVLRSRFLRPSLLAPAASAEASVRTSGVESIRRSGAT
jgi:hypothetical protein